MTSASSLLIYPLVVAAGVGKRFGGTIPKQYTRIHDKTVLQHSIHALSQVEGLQPCTLVVAQDDEFVKKLSFNMPVTLVDGGAERMHSVFNGVKAILQNCPNPKNAWVLIHDAARPCVYPNDIQKLIDQVTSAPHFAGGLLAVPVRDTVKQMGEINDPPLSIKTLERSQLWLAQTPQLFLLEKLYTYLSSALIEQIAFTDEASLFEHFGEYPILVEGSHSNIKLTFAEDELIAKSILAT